MMTGFGQFGPIEMGGMFTLMKIREGLAANDYRDPGPYKHPEGTVAYEFTGDVANAPRQSAPAREPAAPARVMKPSGSHKGH